MNQLIINALKDTGIPILFGIRGETNPPCVVFNFFEEPFASSCDGEELTKGKILLNLYHYGDFTSKAKEVDQLMKSNGFIRKMKSSAFFNDALGCWVQPMEYIKIIESELI